MGRRETRRAPFGGSCGGRAIVSAARRGRHDCGEWFVSSEGVEERVEAAGRACPVACERRPRRPPTGRVRRTVPYRLRDADALRACRDGRAGARSRAADGLLAEGQLALLRGPL